MAVKLLARAAAIGAGLRAADTRVGRPAACLRVHVFKGPYQRASGAGCRHHEYWAPPDA